MTTRSALFVLGVLTSGLGQPVSGQESPWRAVISHDELYDRFNEAEMYSVNFVTRHVGWAVGGHSYAQATMVFHTADGGATWQRLTLFDGQDHLPDVRAVRFADATHGWMAAGTFVLKTRDGGESWEPVDVGENDYRINTLLVMGPDAVMAGSNSRNGDQIHMTTDGGTSWHVASVTEDGHDDVVALAFTAPDRFFAVTASAYKDRGGIYRSTDGGHSWEAAVEGADPIWTIDFRGERGVAAGNGVAYWTDDGGDTWHKGMTAGVRYAVRFADADHIVAVGTNPAVLISADGGRTWQAGRGPDTGDDNAELRDLALVDAGWWFAAGGRGANAVFHFLPPNVTMPMAFGRVPIPSAVRLPGGEVLTRGVYDVMLNHSVGGHALALSRAGELPPLDNGAAVAASACDSPCSADFPIEVEYDVVEEGATSFKLEVTPSGTGLALVLEGEMNLYPTTARDALRGAGRGATDTGARGVAVANTLRTTYRYRLRQLLEPVAPAQGSPDGGR